MYLIGQFIDDFYKAFDKPCSFDIFINVKVQLYTVDN